jgi:hypothetical protein
VGLRDCRLPIAISDWRLAKNRGFQKGGTPLREANRNWQSDIGNILWLNIKKDSF